MQNKSAAARVQANLKELFEGKLAPGDAYVKFQLTSITALLSMKQVKESSIIEAQQITLLPNMPEFALGIISLRDRVFCIFDLALLLGLSSELTSSRQHQIIVFQTVSEPSIYVGFAVTQLQGIVRISQEQIQITNDSISAELMPYVSGMIEQEKNKIPILRFENILQALKA